MEREELPLGIQFAVPSCFVHEAVDGSISVTIASPRVRAELATHKLTEGQARALLAAVEAAWNTQLALWWDDVFRCFKSHLGEGYSSDGE